MQRATILHTLPDLRLGGGQVLLLRLINQLADFEHIVFSSGGGEMLDAFRNEAAAVHVVGSASTGAVRVAKLARQHTPDLVHTNNTPTDRLIGQIAAAAAGTPLINTFHSLPTIHGGSLGRARRGVNRLLSKSNRVSSIAVSHHVASMYIDALGLAPDSITVIHPGIDVERFVNAVEAPTDLAPKPTDRIRFVSVGRFTSPKNMNWLVEAMVEVRASVPGAELLIVGDGDQLNHVQRRISELDLDGVVQLLGQRDDVPNILRQCDVFVTATQLEGFGMAPLEAMACGLPVVACDIPVFREFLDNTVGRLVERDQLAAAMVELAQDDSLRGASGETAMARASEFTIERYAASVAASYRSRIAWLAETG